MTGNLMEWWKSTVRNHRPIVLVVAVVVGLLVVFNGAFFVAAYFRAPAGRATTWTRTSTSGRRPPTRTYRASSATTSRPSSSR